MFILPNTDFLSFFIALMAAVGVIMLFVILVSCLLIGRRYGILSSSSDCILCVALSIETPRIITAPASAENGQFYKYLLYIKWFDPYGTLGKSELTYQRKCS